METTQVDDDRGVELGVATMLGGMRGSAFRSWRMRRERMGLAESSRALMPRPMTSRVSSSSSAALAAAAAAVVVVVVVRGAACGGSTATDAVCCTSLASASAFAFASAFAWAFSCAWIRHAVRIAFFSSVSGKWLIQLEQKSRIRPLGGRAVR